ncbi:MAG: toxin-antitoxin system HicB family antitoxin [Candidatus Heimdallarchaeota archaeon]|nr:toxin-antitoxin system HicB family antitoxin [Candidatus Heimdallarchaeota archaeon]
MKSAQLNLRISENLKQKLSEQAEQEGISLSDLIRQTLEQSITNKKHELHEPDRIKQLRRLMYAGAHIASIDTGKPLEECLAITRTVMEQEALNVDHLSTLSRRQLEQFLLRFHPVLQNQLGVSDRVLIHTKLMFATLLGQWYDDHILDLSPLSETILKALRADLKNQPK